MSVAEIDTLDAAVLSTLLSAREFGTWDTDWYDYAPSGWGRRVKYAPRALVVSISQYLALERPHPLFELVADIGRLVEQDELFAAALMAHYSRENMPWCLAEVFAHYENARCYAQ